MQKKNKFYVPIFGTLVYAISLNISDRASQDTTFDLKYAYSQLRLHLDTAIHCHFNLISGDMTVNYRMV